MTDGWEERRRAKEEEFFNKQNQAALERLKSRDNQTRLSPITGEPMEQITIEGVTVDRCKTSKGIWLDANELEILLKHAEERGAQGGGWFKKLFSDISS